MRMALVVVGLALVTTSAVATDLVVRQRSATTLAGAGPREETVYLTAARVVTDSAAMRTIVDLDRKTITAADKTKRVYTVMTFDEVTAQMEALRKQLADLPPEVRRQMGPILDDDGPPVTVTATGKIETIAGYRAAEYALKGGPYTGSVWATEALPTPPAFRKWKALDRGGPGGGRQLGQAMQKIQGFPLRTRIETRTGEQTVVLSNEVLEVKEASPPSDVLAVPSGFSQQAPGLQ